MDLVAAYEPVVAEVRRLLPDEAVVVDAHTHLGRDEDGQSLEPAALLAFLDQVAPTARACTFPLHDPERKPAYRVPNDRVLQWARDSGGRLYPYCRLDPAEEPVREAERCLALGARGIKLHPRAQSFGFGNAAAESIWKVAQEADVPILIHAGRGMPRMDPLADLALRFPDVVLVLAHAAIADQGMFAARLRDHPGVVLRHLDDVAVRSDRAVRPRPLPSGSCSPPTSRTDVRSAPCTPRCGSPPMRGSTIASARRLSAER